MTGLLLAKILNGGHRHLPGSGVLDDGGASYHGAWYVGGHAEEESKREKETTAENVGRAVSGSVENHSCVTRAVTDLCYRETPVQYGALGSSSP